MTYKTYIELTLRVCQDPGSRFRKRRPNGGSHDDSEHRLTHRAWAWVTRPPRSWRWREVIAELGAGGGIFPWPNEYQAAAAFSFDVDAESCVLVHDPASVNRMSLMSHQSYGPRVAVPKLLNILRRQGVLATFFVPGFTAECYPDIVRAMVDGGHEVAHHGYLHEQMRGIDRDTEARYTDRGLRALYEVAGVVPVGYRAPWWEMNWHTPALLAERGFLYDSSLLDGDAPYRFAVEAGSDTSLIEIPVHWGLDDWEPYAFYPDWTGSGVIESPVKVTEMWQLEADAQHQQGGCFVLTNHPFISGRPSRAAALEQLIEGVKALDGMWVTTLAQIAQHAATVCHDVYTHPRLSVPSFPDGPVLRDDEPITSAHHH